MRPSRFLPVVCVSVAVLISVPGALFAQEKSVTAEGIAAVTGDDANSMLKAKDEAVNRAQRKAIEEGVGSLVDSETMVENFQLLDDKLTLSQKPIDSNTIRACRITHDNNRYHLWH